MRSVRNNTIHALGIPTTISCLRELDIETSSKANRWRADAITAAFRHFTGFIVYKFVRIYMGQNKILLLNEEKVAFLPVYDLLAFYSRYSPIKRNHCTLWPVNNYNSLLSRGEESKSSSDRRFRTNPPPAMRAGYSLCWLLNSHPINPTTP